MRLDSTETQQDLPAETGSHWLTELIDWLKYILIAILIGLLLVVFVIQRNSVIGHSMVPTLFPDDQLIVEKVSRGLPAFSMRYHTIRHRKLRRTTKPRISSTGYWFVISRIQ